MDTISDYFPVCKDIDVHMSSLDFACCDERNFVTRDSKMVTKFITAQSYMEITPTMLLWLRNM